jgi:drug/metabolite transporter (DMT)-like permease
VEYGAIGYGIAGQAMLGSSFAISAAVTHYPFAVGQGGRYLVAALALLAVAAVRRVPLHRPRPRELARLAALAATGLVAFNLCLLGALRHASPAAVGVVVGGTPLVLAVLAPARAGRMPGARVLAGAVLVVLGVALVEGTGRVSLLGLLLATGTLACEVAFTMLAEPLLPRFGPLAVSAYICLLAIPELALLGPLTDHHLRLPTHAELAALAYLGGVLTTFAFLFWYRCVARIGGDRAGLLTGVIPVAALITGTALGRDRIQPLPLLGVITVAAGVTLGLAAGRGKGAGSATGRFRPTSRTAQPG